MKRTLLVVGLAVLLGVGLASSRVERPRPELVVEVEDRNPWTGLKLNNDPAAFQFVLVSDRTGGHRAQVFSRAVARINLLQPEFVVSVGDLIEGGNKAAKTINAEWEEFDSYVKQLEMPFFYVPGNHDVGNKNNRAIWGERLGRRHYHFLYRNVLFLVLDTDDPPGSGIGKIDRDQVRYAEATLKDNPGVRWTIVLLHKPIWNGKVAENGWGAVERALADRPYTVFCGHVHRFRKFVRQGRDYYQLATTGGGSRLRGVEYGEFDHVTWVTMKKDGPRIAHILLDSIVADDLKVPPSSEKGVKRAVQPTVLVRASVHLDGSPLADANVVFEPLKEKVKDKDKEKEVAKGVAAYGLVEGDGRVRMSTYGKFDGVVPGEYRVAITKGAARVAVPARYTKTATTPLRVTIGKEGPNEVALELKSR